MPDTTPHLDPQATTAPLGPAFAAPLPAGPRFHVLRPHAAGGLGRVSVALDSQLRREVALKEIRDEYAGDGAARARFLAEAEITGQLEHPAIVPVYALEVGDDGSPRYAMRFVRGRTLAEAIAAHHAAPSALSLNALLRSFVTVCNAAAYAHSRGIIHRDVKPANILVGEFGETLLIDWGIARRHGGPAAPSQGPNPTPTGEDTLRSGQTQEGSTVGTPTYMPPEQARGELARLGPWSDVYALGATLYELVSGHRPYASLSLLDTLKASADGTPPPPARCVNAGVPAALSAACEKAMAPAPEGRYPSALELAADVERWLADDPVSAYREPWHARLARWGRRNRTLVAAAAVLLLLAAPLAGALAWVSDTARRKALADAAEIDTARLKAVADGQEIEKKRDEADEARKVALRNAERSQRIRDFYEKHVLKAARPGGDGLGPEVTLREALDKARAAIGPAFAGLPEDEAAVCQALAETYARLGEAKAALEVQKVALAAMERVPGRKETDLIDAQADLARLIAAGGRPLEAIPLMREAIARLEKAVGPDDRLTLTAMNNLGYALNEVGRHDEAAKVLRDTLARRRRAGASAADVGLTMNNLSTSLAPTRPAEALRLIEGAMDGLPGRADDPDRLMTRANRAMILIRLGHEDAALREYRTVLPVARVAVGRTGGVTLLCLNNIGFILNNKKEFKEAEAVLAELLALRTQALGPGHPETLITRTNRAFSLYGLARRKECVAELEAALPLLRKAGGPRSANTKNCLLMMIQVYFEMGDIPNAQRMKKQLDEIGGA